MKVKNRIYQNFNIELYYHITYCTKLLIVAELFTYETKSLFITNLTWLQCLLFFQKKIRLQGVFAMHIHTCKRKGN